MTIVVPGSKSIFLGAQAFIVDEDKEIAANSWASKHVIPNKALKWILGRFVEADNPNSNRQMWTHDDLVMAKPTIHYAPMNILHQPRNIVGAFVAAEMMYPNEDIASVPVNPYIEALGAFWKTYFPQELMAIQRAHDNGELYYSMECIAETVTFRDSASGEEQTFDYRGPFDESYGQWNERAAIRQFNKPHFLGGALIVPPTRPGWANADIKDISAFVKEHADLVEQTYLSVSEEMPHLDFETAERITLELLNGTISDQDLNNVKHKSNDESADETRLSVDSNVSIGGNTVTTYTEEDVKRAIAEAVAPVQAELDALKAAAEVSAFESKIVELKEQYEGEIAELQMKLDTAVLEAEAAKSACDVAKAEFDAIVAWLEGEKEAAAAAELFATRKEERSARVQEVASFPASHIEANADRWAKLDDDAFDALLADYAAAAASIKSGSGEGTSGASQVPAETAMKAESTNKNSVPSYKESINLLRGADLSTL